MRQLDGYTLKRLIAKKITLTDDDGNVVHPETLLNRQKLENLRNKPSVEIPKEEPKQKVAVELSEVIKVNSEAISKIIDIEKTLSEVVKEISKPKEKKKWSCSVGRDAKGTINIISVNEL